MAQKDSSQFDKLSSNLGKQVLAEYISSYGQYLDEGKLSEVNPFENVIIGDHKITFIGNQYSIKTILDEQGELLYHNPHIVSHPEADEVSKWIKYFSGFSDENLEERENENHKNLINRISQFDRKKSSIKIEGGRIVKPELREYWGKLCNDKHLLLYSLEPALDVMRELGNGFHMALSDVDDKYGLSGYQFNTMVNAINHFSQLPHPEAQHHGKWLDQMRSR